MFWYYLMRGWFDGLFFSRVCDVWLLVVGEYGVYFVYWLVVVEYWWVG